MKKSGLLMAFLIWASFATAQKTHMYVGLGLAWPLYDQTEYLPLFGLQVGAMVADNVELRANLETLLLINLYGADVLYTAPIPDSNSRFYAGLGVGGEAQVSDNPDYGGGFDIRAPIGVEFFTTPEQTIGFYAEAQPNLSFSNRGSAFFINLRAGVNFHWNF